MRILLVEDDPTTARSVEMMLTHANYNVFLTDMGEEGIDLAKLYDYDLILLDLDLPDMHGMEVLRQIRLTLCKIIAHEGAVFGASSRECGNYRNLSLDAAKTEARRYLAELDARPVTFIYEE